MRLAARGAHQRIDHHLQHRHAEPDHEQAADHDAVAREQRDRERAEQIERERGEQRRSAGRISPPAMPAGIETMP